MNGYEVLVRGRALAEDASFLSLKALVDHVLLLGRLAEGEYPTAHCYVVTAPIEQCDLGRVFLKWSRVKDALGMSPTGWVVGRVVGGHGIKEPVPGDFALARQRVEALGLDWLRS